MPQNTEKNTIEVTLNGPADWDSWDHQFKIKAVAANLWDHVDPEVDEPLLKKPRMPLVGSYQRQANRRPNAGNGQNAERSQTVEADDDDDQNIAPSALSDRGRAALQLDMQYYTQQEKEFREQHNAVQKLKKWITDTVAPHYVEVACEATETLIKGDRTPKDKVGTSGGCTLIATRTQAIS